jgi:hypothetical protein
VKAPLLGFIEPALASSIEKVPSGERWIHEIKFDGYRSPGSSSQRSRHDLHPPRSRLDPPLQEGHARRLADQGQFGGGRR